MSTNKSCTLRVVIAPDSFKECLAAEQVAQAIARGWRLAAPDDQLVTVPLADGGEGTTRALTEARQGQLHTVKVTGPMGEPVSAHFGLVNEGEIAIVEVAEASGLHCVPASSRNALTASSFGIGELILAALEHKPKTLIMGLGGSATTDGGAGILQALGARLLDDGGHPIPRGGAGLAELASLDLAPALERLAGVKLVVACDVNNPLLGPNGAAAVFGPQKGADSRQVVELDRNLGHFARLVEQQGMDIASFSGSGAAGGIGGMVAGILEAELRPGIELVMETVELESHLARADLVITAEGAIDSQSAYGKTPAGVASLAKKYGVPVIGLAGKLGAELGELHRLGLSAAFSITPAPMELQEAYSQAADNLETAAGQLARLVHSVSGRR
ncbi:MULTISPECIES: glycerate kinase [unclassified Marinobacter]|uniref:glycerate kinase n=1 Tax=unclassified Marinobacter TaxID=83889 RepID=UPI001267C024|nr:MULTISPECIES: glycerate kinase [unclassified Marinobacter]QFS86367.1 Glycerate 2-kinase [Marinobacter sp. THAF197a]QFT50148.1 Glycerate 2-kinase [Marinobacter sp. THAF39]